MDTYAPLISTRATGPLGVVHLPRLWLKMRLHAKGKLAEGYRAGEGGFDGAVFEALGLSADDAVAYVRDEEPSYLAFEAWARERAKPDRLTADAVAPFHPRIFGPR